MWALTLLYSWSLPVSSQDEPVVPESWRRGRLAIGRTRRAGEPKGVSVDREALEHSLVRRLLDHIEHRTTDMAEDVMEVPAATYTSREHYERELDTLFADAPLVFCLSGALPRPGAFWTVDLCGTPVLLTRDSDGVVHAMANVCRHRGVRVVDGSGERVGSPVRFTPGCTTLRETSSACPLRRASRACAARTRGSSSYR